MNLSDKTIRAIREKWDELDYVFIRGPLHEPKELLDLMRRHQFVQGLRFDRDLDLNYLPRQINLSRLDYCTDNRYHLYPEDLRKVDGPWHRTLPFSFPNLVILEIFFKEATYWLPAILRAVTSALKRIILRDGDDIIDSARVFDFPIGELNTFLLQHPETRLILPFVSCDERAIWVGELFFVFQLGRALFLSGNDLPAASGLDPQHLGLYEPRMDPFDSGRFFLEVTYSRITFSNAEMSLEFEGLDTQSYSLDEFSLACNRLVSDQTTRGDFIRFALTGAYNGDDPNQAVLDPLQNALEQNHSLSAVRDYDSLLGLSAHIAFNNPITIYPAAKFEDTLSKNIHLYAPVDNLEVPLHTIPNVALGKCGERSLIRIFFPKLHSGDRKSSTLTREEQEIFYECGLRPTIERLAPEKSSEWPVTYRDELTRARRHTGRFAMQTKMVPRSILRELGDTLRYFLDDNGVAWGEDLFFLHQVRGMKATTEHFMDARSARDALRAFLFENSISEASTRQGIWYIDVGLEISSDEGMSLLWRTDSHSHVVKHVTGISEQQANRITELGSQQYARDLASHLLDVSGCRITPGRRGEGPFEVAYLQMYSTDKSLTYNPEGYHFSKAMTCVEAIGKTQPPSFTESLYHLYRNASLVPSSSANARVEVRVLIKHATAALINLSSGLIHRSLVAFTNESWWGLKAYRMCAVGMLMEDAARADKQYRVNGDCLLLINAAVWLVNSLNARHQDNSAGRDLMNACLPCIDRVDADQRTLAYNTRLNVHNEDDASSSVPYIPFGMIFFRRIVLPSDGGTHPVHAPRFKSGRHVREDTFVKFWGKPIEGVCESILPVGIVGREAIPRTRVVTNKGRITPKVWTDNNPRPILFKLAENGHTLPPPNARDGSDMETSDDDDDNGDGTHRDIDRWMSDLWRQFISDIIMKSPNRKGQLSASYCRLTLAQKRSVTEDNFRDPNLAKVWNACLVKVGDENDWEAAFKHLWPEVGHQCVKGQGYAQSSYYRTWKEMIARIQKPETVKAMRHAFKRRLYKLKWIPRPASDKLWVSTANGSGFSRYPKGSTGAAPHILTHLPPVWDETVVVAGEEEGEEEEEEDEQ